MAILSDAGVSFSDAQSCVLFGWRVPLNQRVVALTSERLPDERSEESAMEVCGKLGGAAGSLWHAPTTSAASEIGEFLSSRKVELTSISELTNDLLRMVTGHESAREVIADILTYYPHPARATPFKALGTLGDVAPATKQELSVIRGLWQWLLAGTAEHVVEFPVKHFGALMGALQLSPSERVDERAVIETLPRLGSFLYAMSQEVGRERIAHLRKQDAPPNQVECFVDTVSAFVPGMAFSANGKPLIDIPSYQVFHIPKSKGDRNLAHNLPLMFGRDVPPTAASEPQSDPEEEVVSSAATPVADHQGPVPEDEIETVVDGAVADVDPNDDEAVPAELPDRMRMLAEMFVASVARDPARAMVIVQDEPETMVFLKYEPGAYPPKEKGGGSKGNDAAMKTCWQLSFGAHAGEPHPPAARTETAMPWDILTGVVVHATSPILIVGGTGTGKDRIARVLHQRWCSNGPYVAYNCAAAASTLVVADILGHVEGAFSGATTPRLGLFLRAAGAVPQHLPRRQQGRSPSDRLITYAGLRPSIDGTCYELPGAISGTLFLDEIANLPPAAQGALLRMLGTDSPGFEPLGWDKAVPIRVSFRVVAATRNIEMLLDETAFRQDLRARLDTWVVRTVDTASQDVPIAMSAAQLRLDELNSSVTPPRSTSFTPDAFQVLADRIRAGRFDGLEGGNIRGIRAAVERAWTAVRAQDPDALDAKIEGHVMKWGCGSFWRLAAPPSRTLVEHSSPAAAASAAPSAVETMPEDVKRIVDTVRETIGAHHAMTRGVEVQARAAQSADGLLYGLCPDAHAPETVESLSEEERLKRELFKRVWLGEQFAGAEIAKIYTIKATGPRKVATMLGLPERKELRRSRGRRKKKRRHSGEPDAV